MTFGLEGRFAYVAGRKGGSDPTDIIDARTCQRVGQLSPSEDLLEIDMTANAVVAVGNRFGLGRLDRPNFLLLKRAGVILFDRPGLLIWARATLRSAPG